MFEIAVTGLGLTGLYSFMRSLTLFSAYEMVFMMNFLSAGESLSQLSMTLRGWINRLARLWERCE